MIPAGRTACQELCRLHRFVTTWEALHASLPVGFVVIGNLGARIRLKTIAEDRIRYRPRASYPSLRTTTCRLLGKGQAGAGIKFLTIRSQKCD